MIVSLACKLQRLALVCLLLAVCSPQGAAQDAEDAAKKSADLQVGRNVLETVREQQREVRAAGVNRFDAMHRGASTIARFGIRVDNSIVMVAVELLAEEPQQKQPALPAEGPPAAPQQPPARRIARIEAASFDQLVFGSGGSAGAARVRLLSQLRKRVEDVDLTCRLSEMQQKKLKLAGRGDIQRFFEHVEELKIRSQNISVIGDEANARNLMMAAQELCQQAESLHRELDSGVFDRNSLFAKTLRKSLSGEQAAKFAAHEARVSQKGAPKSSPTAKSAK